MNRQGEDRTQLLTRGQQLMRDLHRDGGGRILLLVADGLGGLPEKPGGQTELESAHTPNMDELAAKNTCGLIDPVLPGIACGSGPGHLALFGYDPLAHSFGRGVLTATGIGFELTDRDVAFRGNFATLDEEGKVTDRRAGRITSEETAPLIECMRGMELDDVELFIEPVQGHRFCLIMRGDGLHADVSDTDPQVAGEKPRRCKPASLAARPTAELVNQFMDKAKQCLESAGPAGVNGVLLRGAGMDPHLPTVTEVYGLKGAASAIVPMYRGVAKLFGMRALEHEQTLAGQVSALMEAWEEHDLLFLHHKTPDKKGEDGDFEARCASIEALDEQLPRLLEREPDVLIITGDHSTPARLGGHSWHPVPVLLASQTCRPDEAGHFGERDCVRGGLGRFDAQYVMPLAMAHAQRLDKYGA